MHLIAPGKKSKCVRIRRFFWSQVLILATVSCGKKDSNQEAQSPLPYGGVAIAAIAPDFSSSKLYVQSLSNGLPSGELRVILSGESGDPWTVTLGERLYFFNRTTTSSNFRTLGLGQSDFAPTPQTRTEKAGVGDPHDALLLAPDRMLLAHYIAGKLIVINPADGSVKQEISADFDLGADPKAVFRPEVFYRVSNSADAEIYVVNQGRNNDYSGFTGAQQIFVLRDDGQTVTTLDLDPNKDKIQGIKLNLVNPQIIDGRVDPEKPVIGGLCTILDQASPCTSGFEQVDLSARTSRVIYDLTSALEKGNGNVVAGVNGKFYAAVATHDRSAGFKSQIQEFDINTKSSKNLYPITDPNYAAYALSFDQRAQRLYVGEKKTDGTGQVTILDANTERSDPPQSLGIPLPPAKITFLP